MNPSGKKHDTDGLADTEMAMSSGGAFDRTELGDPRHGRAASSGQGTGQGTGQGKGQGTGQASGTLTDMAQGAARRRVTMDIQRGERYEVEAEHARGGLGRVLRARDEHLGRTVAIKELLEANDFAESLFIREALITARLQHPGIVPVHEAGRWPSGDPYYVMKLLSGESMRKLIRKKRTLAERIELLPNVLDVVETIAYAHSQGIIHRDIKPANVMVGEFGETVVVDWGLARDGDEARQPVPPLPALAEDAVQAEFSDERRGPRGKAKKRSRSENEAWQVSGNYSISGKVVGTPAYMSPEQARGADVDERTDVYALGALLYEVLAGKPPYPGEHLQAILERVLAGPPQPLAERLADNGEEIQPDLITIVERAMARDRDERYPTAKELAEDLKRFQTGQLVSVHEYKTWTLFKRWVERNRAPLFVASIAVVLLAVFGALSVNRIVDERNAAETERAMAQAARAQAEHSTNKLRFSHAERALTTDPTSTLAYLARIPLDDDNFSAALELVEQAVALGVSRHVLQYDEPAHRMAYTPDGAHVLISDLSGRLLSIDVTTAAEEVIARTDDIFEAIAVSEHDTWVAAGTTTGRISLFRLADAPLRDRAPVVIDGPSTEYRLRFSESGDALHAWTRDRESYTWSVPGGELVRTSQVERGSGEVVPPMLANTGPAPHQLTMVSPSGGHERPVRFDLPAPIKHMAPSGDRQRMVAVAEDGFMYRLDAKTGDVLRLGEFTENDGAKQFGHLIVSRGGRYLVTRLPRSGTIRLWNLDEASMRELEGHADTVFSMRFSEDERFLITSSDDTTLRIWDMETLDVQVLRGHTDDIYHLVVSPDGKTFTTAARDQTVRIWPVQRPEAMRIARAQSPMGTVVFDGADAVIDISVEGEIVRRDLTSGTAEEIANASRHVAYREHAISPGRRFLVTGDESTFERWEVRTGEKRVFTGDDIHGRSALIAWAPDDDGFAVFMRDGAVHAWRGEDAEHVSIPADDTRCGIALSPGGEHLALVHGRYLRVLELATMEDVAITPIEAERSCQLYNRKLAPIYSPDGSRLAIAYPRIGMLVWDARTHAFERYPVSPSMAVQLRFSDESTRVASSHNDLSVYLVDLRTRTTKKIGYHRDIVYSMHFSPSGETLATNSYDQTIRLWDMDGDDHRVLRGHSGGVTGVAFSPDGTRLASVGWDQTLRIWDLERVIASDGPSLRSFIERQTTATLDDADMARTPRGPL